jgi:hypothetical protein
VAQVVEFLPSKCKDLSSNPRTTKKKKKERKGLFPDKLGKINWISIGKYLDLTSFQFHMNYKSKSRRQKNTASGK